MSDSMSPDNLGYAFFSAYRKYIWGESQPIILRQWHLFSDEDRTRWAQCSDVFYAYVKKAEADS
jgi:hypothetical protein